MKIIYCLLLTVPLLVKAQQYNVNSIPDSLKTNADAVLRNDYMELKIYSPREATVYTDRVVTILNEDGLRYAHYFNTYDKFQKINKVVAHLYDRNGTLLKTVKKKDMTDMAYDDRVSILNDERVITFDFAWKAFPYTVEVEEEIEYKGIFQLPVWQPVANSRYSVETSAIMVSFPADYKLHYKLMKNTLPPEVTTQKNFVQYNWSLSHLPAFEKENYGPEINDITPGVYLAPSSFEIGGYQGNMDTWQNFGNFIQTLNKGRNVLPDNIRKEVHDIADKLPTGREKTDALYNYLQQNTRYISIQMGIGSWQPFEAAYVAKNKYGDCKALSNYMVALLNEAGVNAKYVLVSAGAGKKGLSKDFPVNSFNHAIMCVPEANDTTWLECTSHYTSPGFMGSFTGDRDVLMIDDNGGVVVHTPVYKASDNLEIRNIKATVDDNGNLTADISTHYSGISQEHILSLMYEASKEEKDKYLNSILHLPTYHVESSGFKEVKGKIPVVEEQLKITAPGYANVTSRRIFLQPDLINKEIRLDTSKKRKSEICFTRSFTDIDSITISIPAGYNIESVAKDVAVTNQFGSYSLTTRFNNNTISLYRKHIRYAGTYPASDFPLLAAWYDTMQKTDNGRMVLVKKE